MTNDNAAAAAADGGGDMRLANISSEAVTGLYESRRRPRGTRQNVELSSISL